MFLTWWVCLAFLGCGSQVLILPSPTLKEAPPPAKKPDAPSDKQTPRAVAALQLTEQARILLSKDQPDDAIRLLEQAVNLNPSNGQNYYYLSEAWLLKGNLAQAKEFNRLAASYLEKDPEWMPRVQEQQGRITERSP